jgi:hypothetical protein
MAVPMTISAAVADFGGRSFAARADLCHQYSLSPVSLTPAIKFFPGVIDTGQK